MFGFLPVGGAQLWTPKSPNNLLAWYDAKVGVTIDGSNNVTSWADQSGNNYTLTNAGTGPTYSATSWDGSSQPALSFHGFDEGQGGNVLLNSGGLATYISSGSHSNPMTILAIMEVPTASPVSSSNNATIISWDDNPTLANIANYYINNSQHLGASYGGALIKVEGTTNATNTKKSIGYMAGSDGYFDSYVGGAKDMNNAGPIVISMANSTRVVVGVSWIGPTSSYSGKIAELIIYSKKLTSTEYFDFYNYAKAKWIGV